ncbi:hypothetical protein [Marispirochaeta aestuarii]|uniref:hypothetical protein n=1 Tax=Marispirochaeta aestuarii TaxID=1963862 RepID=UPI0029C63435|nr:hypothetical protein [Marispirochaeta aestuarii]
MSTQVNTVYHETDQQLNIVIPETDWLCDSACMVLELIQARLESAPTAKDRRALDSAAEAFFQRLGV